MGGAEEVQDGFAILDYMLLREAAIFLKCEMYRPGLGTTAGSSPE